MSQPAMLPAEEAGLLGDQRWTRAFLVCNWVMGLLFALSAGVQLNDPDPLGWVLIYGVAAAICFFDPTRARAGIAAAGVGAVALVVAVWWAPAAWPALGWSELARTMTADRPAVELSREMLGLAAVAAWMGVRVLYARSAAAGRRPGQ